jgi:hypothetical protein
MVGGTRPAPVGQPPPAVTKADAPRGRGLRALAHSPVVHRLTSRKTLAAGELLTHYPPWAGDCKCVLAPFRRPDRPDTAAGTAREAVTREAVGVAKLVSVASSVGRRRPAPPPGPDLPAERSGPPHKSGRAGSGAGPAGRGATLKTRPQQPNFQGDGFAAIINHQFRGYRQLALLPPAGYRLQTTDYRFFTTEDTEATEVLQPRTTRATRIHGRPFVRYSFRGSGTPGA